MLTTLCITSLHQGNFAPRYDVEPKSAEELAEAAAGKMEQPMWQVTQAALAIWKRIPAGFGHWAPSDLSHT